MSLLLAALLGVVAGLRAMTAPAVTSWALYLGCLGPTADWTAFMGYRFTPWIFTALALAELVTDQLPSTPSRKVPIQFATRILMGALCGATIGSGGGQLVAGAILGATGAIVGALGGAAARARLAAALGRDRPAALIEDTVAIGGAILAIGLLA